MSEEFNFQINDDGNVNVKIANPDGSSANRVVKFEDFAKVFTVDNQEIDLPLFPKGLRKYRVFGDRTVVVLEYPSCVVAQASWRGDDIYRNIPVPNSVWFTLLKNNPDGTYTILKNHLFALDFMGLVSEDSTFYKWPFPNHSLTYSPGICWGNDRNFERLKTTCKLTDLHSLFSMYFSAAFNNDLGFHIRNNDSENPLRGDHILEMVAGQESYKQEWLMRDEKSFSTEINSLIGGGR